jgi:hypothetical protein
MYEYPLTFTFSALTLTPSITAQDAAGNVVFTASNKLISTKDEVNVISNGKPVSKILSEENRITDIPSNWDILAPDGRKIGVVDDDFISSIDTSKFIKGRGAQIVANMGIERALNLKALKMYWIKDASGKKVGLIAPDKDSMFAMELPLYEIVRKLPIFFRFITPR